MWALRRAAKPIRGHAFRFGGPRASAVASEVFCGALEHGVDNHGHSSIIPFTIIQPKRFYQRPSVPTKFFFGTHCLSSQAGTKSSGDEDDPEDGFSELETPLGNETAAGNSVGEEAAEDLISEPELSDADSADDLSEAAPDELDLSDDEPSDMSSKKVARKKTLGSPLFKVIMESPRQSINSAIDKRALRWAETEISVAMLNLRKRRMFGRALQNHPNWNSYTRTGFVGLIPVNSSLHNHLPNLLHRCHPNTISAKPPLCTTTPSALLIVTPKSIWAIAMDKWKTLSHTARISPQQRRGVDYTTAVPHGQSLPCDWQGREIY
ncbi:pentatricopeptide repeat-containing protein, mitochondrial-like protein [Cinnamomum micranthum f. kanehirae]|uniref:Pentatricopeptide repeat-containing protein, mitochondrial-like protein n=1 Tax=Cinnamomum micranthum f. kanehirae TaxID=337451 RepID=A0A3S3PTM8_9MAGN|nr:pentatricopeptide repeat-containing protein, mitochondrial-like protein [Cinnamomum micranthum f. kanehirae]